jgi:hypothetical protein
MIKKTNRIYGAKAKISIGVFVLVNIFIYYLMSTSKKVTQVHDISEPSTVRRYPITRKIDPQVIQKKLEAHMHKQPSIVSQTEILSDTDRQLAKIIPPNTIRTHLTFDNLDGKPPSDAELALLSKGMGHINPENFKGGLSASLQDLNTMMKHKSQWQSDPQNPLAYRNEVDKMTMTWEIDQQGQIKAAHFEFEDSNSAPSMLGNEYLLGAGESWGLIWKSDTPEPLAGVVELADQRKVYYYCELHIATGPPYEPALCDFRLNQVPQSVYEYYQQAQAKPLKPFTSLITQPQP